MDAPIPSFKDFLAADLQTFMNPREFGEPHIINDKAYTVIIEENTRDGKPFPTAEGVSLFQKIVHMISADLGYIPKVTRVMNLDGLDHTITNVAVDAGILKITLEANES